MSTPRRWDTPEAVRERLGAGARHAGHRLRLYGWSILQTALAAGLAYFVAAVVIGAERPFFAPIAAVVSLGLSVGRRGRRAVEVVFGVAVGLLVADLIVLVIGVGAVQIGVVVALAMAAVVPFTERNLLVNQAAISAILVVVLTPPQAGFNPDRFVHALIGGGVALAVNHLLPVDPERVVERAVRPILDELAEVLEEIARALGTEDRDLAEQALESSRGVDERVKGFEESLSAGHETARLSPTRRRALKHLELYSSARVRIELAAINTRVLARGAANTLRRGDTIPQVLPEAVFDLSRAVRSLTLYLEEQSEPDETRSFALKAARKATEILAERHDLTASVLVGQIRSAAVDLLRSTGLDQAQALAALEEAAGRSPET